MKRNFLVGTSHVEALPYFNYSRCETDEFYFVNSLVSATKNYGVSGILVDIDVVAVIGDTNSTVSRYFRSFSDIRDYAVFHTRLLLCKNHDELFTLLSNFDFI